MHSNTAVYLALIYCIPMYAHAYVLYVFQVMDICDKICALNVIDLLQLMKLYQSRVGITDDMLASRRGGGGGGAGGNVLGTPLEYSCMNILTY
jgi:hypothetical protein